MAYVNPGAAFSSGIEDYLLQERAQKRADLEMSLTLKQEERLAKAQLESEAERKRAHLELEQQHRDQLEEKKRLDVEKFQQADDKRYEQRVAGMVPGDIRDAELIAGARKRGDPRFQDPKAGLTAFAGTLPEGPTKQAVTTQMGGPVRFLGSPAQRIMEDAKSLKLGSPEWLQKMADVEAANGIVPAATLKLLEGLQEPAFNPVLTREAALKLGQVPKGARIIEPRDTSTAGANREERAARHQEDQVNRTRENAYKELDTRLKPYSDQLAAVENIFTNLDANSNIADSTLAPMVLKATITAGGGSGFRMTQTEINSTLKGTRTNWASLQVALIKWGADAKYDPAKVNLFLTPEQRDGMRKLAVRIRRKAFDASNKILEGRHRVDRASSVQEIDDLRTSILKSILPDIGKDEVETVPPAPKTPADYVKKALGH